MKLKKILIGIIFILSTFIILCLGLVFKNRYDIKVSKNFDNQEIANVETVESLEESFVPSEEIIENNVEEQEQTVIEEQQEIPSTDATLQEVVQQKTSSNSQSKKTASSSITQTAKQETKLDTQSQAQTQTQVIQESTIPEAPKVQETPKATEEKKESNIPVVVITDEPKEIGEKYVRNDAMINKIKSVIENNPSEYMSTYGYNIVVDSSIKENTNQFTFTETRVKSYIGYKFGTIRIYAEDYYKNGQLIMTECYIL